MNVIFIRKCQGIKKRADKCDTDQYFDCTAQLFIVTVQSLFNGHPRGKWIVAAKKGLAV